MFCTSCGHPRQDADVFCTSCGASLSRPAAAPSGAAAVAVPAVVPQDRPAPQLSFSGYAGQPGAFTGVPFWPRAGARVIDLLVHYFVTIVAGFGFGIMLGVIAAMNHQPVAEMTRRASALTVSSFLLALVGSLAYHAVCEGGCGASLGKLAIGAVVVQEDGSACSARAAVVRSLAYFVDSLFFGIIAYMAMEKSPQQQRYGDRWAHTIVVKKEQAPAASRPSGGRFAAVFLLACMVDAATTVLALTLKMV